MTRSSGRSDPPGYGRGDGTKSNRVASEHLRGILAALSKASLENFLELIHFEDLPLAGQWTTRRRTITEADLSAYTGLSGDFNPLYTDVEHARGSHYGGPVAPAPLIAAVVFGLGAMDVPIPRTVALVGWQWKFKAPVRLGDSIRSRWRLNRKRDVEDRRWGLATWQVEVENQHGELVALAEIVRLVARRESAEPEVPRTGRRRRRRRGGSNGGPPPEAVATQLAAAPESPEPAPLGAAPASEPAGGAAPDQATPSSSSSSRRRRRSKKAAAEAPTDAGPPQPNGGPGAESASPAPPDWPSPWRSEPKDDNPF
ncbi:MAG: MaoC family dehydratase N-terminal domain-containing protein [Candidatus Dormibacteraeota bacterium]|nr:MaoC family dehydratase N-terminal domain-containing protein [Candidatus Dormibacteraeota bacterium]